MFVYFKILKLTELNTTLVYKFADFISEKTENKKIPGGLRSSTTARCRVRLSPTATEQIDRYSSSSPLLGREERREEREGEGRGIGWRWRRRWSSWRRRARRGRSSRSGTQRSLTCTSGSCGTSSPSSSTSSSPSPSSRSVRFIDSADEDLTFRSPLGCLSACGLTWLGLGGLFWQLIFNFSTIRCCALAAARGVDGHLAWVRWVNLPRWCKIVERQTFLLSNLALYCTTPHTSSLGCWQFILVYCI